MGNANLDVIRIGIKDNLIARAEGWCAGQLMEARELGFLRPLDLDANHRLAGECYDETNRRYPGQGSVLMRFYEGSGVFGDIGTISLDLTPYGKLDGDKILSLSPSSSENDEIPFLSLEVWKNYSSFD